MYHIYQFAYIEPCLDPRDEFHLIMYMILLMGC